MARYGQYNFRTIPDNDLPNPGADWSVVHVPTGRLVYQRIPQKDAEQIAAQRTARDQMDGPYVARRMEDKTVEETKQDDGGPAFPCPGSTLDLGGGGREVHHPQQGMCLRDWFAGQALAVLATAAPAHALAEHTRLSTARAAYAIADAMLAARKPAAITDPVLVLDVEGRRNLEVMQEKLEQLQDEGPDGGGWQSDELQAVIAWLAGVRERAHRKLGLDEREGR